MANTTASRRTLFAELLAACRTYGKHTFIIEDMQRTPISYQQLLQRIVILGSYLRQQTKKNDHVGIMLPNTIAAAVSFFACHVSHTIPAMLNYSAGSATIKTVCQAANIKCIITSKQFLETINLLDLVDQLKATSIPIIFLEDFKKQLTFTAKWLGALKTFFMHYCYRFHGNPHKPAVILFTSGSEDIPKAVALSHANLQANRMQIHACIDFNAHDGIFNMMPIFHSFGLMAGTLLPLLSGIRVFFYPSPLHYRIIPPLIYQWRATILFGTDTFLAGYAKVANPDDFQRLRYVVAGAEKLKEETRQLWQEKFGLRIFEGYGATETAPVLAVNTPIMYKPGTVGCFLPEIAYKLESVPGIQEGGRLWVKGPNVMIGYLSVQQPGQIISPPDGWYDTGDIVSIDQEGFVRILGRLKRFAKIAGEMISLTAVEQWVFECWPDHQHAVLSINAPTKGEQLVLVTNYEAATRADLVKHFQQSGRAEIHIPKRIHIVDALPLLPTGKINYVEVAHAILT
jgi:acyl-[acyl-carrier-protein]-phospholipid O-acyltransferase / long-chain-fatty-acid--[acyl-carrier-protein] ligase